MHTPHLLSRDIIQLSGPDTFTLLQGILTNNVEKLPIGGMQHSALLTPQGKITDTMFLIRTERETLFIDVHAGRGKGLLKKLMLYRLRAKIEMSDQSDDLMIGIGPPPPSAVCSAPDPRLGTLPHRFIAPRSSVTETIDAASGAYDNTYADLEVSLGVPAYGTAYHEGEAFPLGVNLDLLNGIDHRKGCFVGQEVASRMFRKGDVRKRTWHILGTGTTPCDDLTVNGRSVAMTSAMSSNCGLALMRLDRIESHDEICAITPSGKEVTLKKPNYLA